VDIVLGGIWRDGEKMRIGKIDGSLQIFRTHLSSLILYSEELGNLLLEPKRTSIERSW
jgi:hypothetical protein